MQIQEINTVMEKIYNAKTPEDRSKLLTENKVSLGEYVLANRDVERLGLPLTTRFLHWVDEVKFAAGAKNTIVLGASAFTAGSLAVRGVQALWGFFKD